MFLKIITLNEYSQFFRRANHAVWTLENNQFPFLSVSKHVAEAGKCEGD